MKKYFKFTPVILVIILTLVLVRCAVNPVTGKKEIMLIPESTEIEMGKEIDRSLRVEYGIYDNPQLNQYVSRIGQKLAPYTHRPHLQYHFAILDTPVVNAFAAPGGYIYVTRGLMAIVNSEAELAVILGHELGHVNARHSAKQLTRTILFTLGIMLAGELSEDIKKVAPVSMIATQLLFLKYSRDNEYQADALGIEYSFKARYAAGEMVRFFSSLERLTQTGGGHKLPTFLSTHPMTPNRIQKVRQLVDTYSGSQPPGAPGLTLERNGYLQRLEGMVYGMNPRHGYVQGNFFYHPDMQFYFYIPLGWDVDNTPRQVTIAPKDGNAVVILQAENTNESLDSYTRRKMESVSNPMVIQQGFHGVNGLNAYHSLFKFQPGSYESETQEQPIVVRLSCIRKGGTVFSFFSATNESNHFIYRDLIDRSIKSFNHLRSRRHLNTRPARLYIKRSSRRQTLQNFLSRLGVPRKHWNQVVLINHLELNQSLVPNQLVKIIR